MTAIQPGANRGREPGYETDSPGYVTDDSPGYETDSPAQVPRPRIRDAGGGAEYLMDRFNDPAIAQRVAADRERFAALRDTGIRTKLDNMRKRSINLEKYILNLEKIIAESTARQLQMGRDQDILRDENMELLLRLSREVRKGADSLASKKLDEHVDAAVEPLVDKLDELGFDGDVSVGDPTLG
jgi:hypothetical protein